MRVLCRIFPRIERTVFSRVRIFGVMPRVSNPYSPNPNPLGRRYAAFRRV